MSDVSDNGEGKTGKLSQPPSLKRSSPPPTRPAAASMMFASVASVSSNGVHAAASGSAQGVASPTDATTASTTAGAPSEDADGQPSEVDAAVDHPEHGAVEACSFYSHSTPASQGPSSVQQAYTFSSSLPSPRSTTAAVVRVAPVTDQPVLQDVGSSRAMSASDVAKWKENREYKMLERGMHKILSAIDSTLSADWATQASLLGQLLACLRQYKGVIGAVELPDGLHFAKALGRTLSPLSVVGVQRKALEVVQCYLELANPVYPMAKDLPFVLPGLLELLPQASVQVKEDVLKLLDRGVVRRLPGSVLRACVQGLVTALLSCLEESETSSIYRGAMGLLEYVQAALARDAPAPSFSSPSQRGEWAELRGGQVLAAHMWVLIRDASALRSPALNVMKAFIAQSGGLTSGSAAGLAEGAAEDAAAASATTSTSTSALPDWVGGDAATMASALLNCLQDTQEKTHRLVLDVLLTVCPLTPVDCDSANFTHTPLAAFFDGNTNKHTSASVGVSPPPCCGNGAIIPFEVKSLLVAAAVQLLGTRYGTSSVARRIFQWLTVDPGVGGGANERPGTDDDDASDTDGGEHRRNTLNSRASSSCVAYVQDITSCVMARGFDMVVEHWWTRWVGKVGDDAPAEQAPPYMSAALSALEHSAAQAIRTATASRLASASSVVAALGAREASSNAIALLDVPVGISVPLVWVRALLVLFRYRSRSTQGGDGALLMSPVAGDAATYEGAEVPMETGCAPFLVHVAPLLLPSLSRLIAGVSSVVGDASGGESAAAAAEMWIAELRELLRVLPWGLFVELDTCAVQNVEELLRSVLHPLCASGVEEGDEDAAPAAPFVSAHLQAVAATRAQKPIAAQMNNLCMTAKALESVLVDAAVEQPSPAQEYVRASLRWLEKVAQLLSEVLKALEAEMRTAGGATGGATTSKESLVCQGQVVQLLLSTANGLLRLLGQRMRLMELMLASVLTAASATGTPSVVRVDFFSAFVSALDACLLGRIRSATAAVTMAALHTSESDASGGGHDTAGGAPATAALFCFPEHASDLQGLLARMHRITLRLTSFLAQLHLRCQQQAVFGVLLDSAPENSAGSRERDFAKQTTLWLESMCDGATVAAAAGAHVFFSRAVRLLLDALLRARGCLLPAVVYSTLEPVCPTAGGVAEGVVFTNTYLLAPVVRTLWEGCAGGGDEAGDAVDMCRTSLLALIALSPACSRCLDTFLLETPADIAVLRLVGLQRELAALRARQRRGQSRSGSTPLLETLAELQDPGVLFLGLLTTLECLLCVPSGILVHGGVIAESTRQPARAYISHAIVRDPSSILLPLHFSFLCPLVTESACSSSTSVESKRRGRTVDAVAAALSPPHSTGSQTLSTVPLTVLLPSVTAAPTAEMTGPVPLARTKWFKHVSGTTTVGHGGVAPRGYRCVEAAELVRYLFALLQLPTAVEWVRQSMDTPTPNSLRVLLRALEEQSFAPSHEVEVTSPSLSPSSSATALACGGATDTLFSATALLLLSLARHALLSGHAAHMRQPDSLRRRPCLHSPSASRSSTSWLSREESTATPQWRCSTLLDAVACLNRLLEVSQTGPRMQPHRTAVNTWQFTAAQLLPLLRLAVQADLHAVQAVLLDHIRGVVFYLDDAGGIPARHKSLSRQANGVDGAVASRHWLPHAFRQSGRATDKASLCSTDPAAQKGHSTLAAAEAAAPASSASDDAAPAFSLPPSSSGTAVLDDLQRAPPAILSNKSLYATMGEVVERVLSHCDAAASPASEVDPTHTDAAAASRSRREEEDTLALWLHFYSDIMPYLYRDLVPSAEMAVDALLCALELPPGARAGDDAPRPVHSLSSYASVQSICYATLVDVAQFLCDLARVADDENYVLAMRKKESMSWIASTFTQEDPVAQAKRATLWDRSPVLSPIRGALPRLITAATHCIRACDAAASEAGMIKQGAAYAMWAADTDTDEALGWGTTTAATAELLPSAGPETHLREQARRLLCLLNHAAGPGFLTAFLHDWCAQYALSSTWWLFEDKQQRERRVSLEAVRHIETECASDVVAPRKGGGDTGVTASGEDERVAAWRMKREAQKAACLLLADIGVSISEVTAVLTPLLRTAIKGEPHAEPLQPEQAPAFTGTSVSGAAASALAPLAPRPSSAAERLFFLDQVVEGHCAERQGGLSDKDAEAVLAVLADVVSQCSPDTLAFCCLFHLLYCVVAYAKDEGAEGQGGMKVRKARRVGGGSGRRRQPKASGTTTAAPATVSGVYRNGHFSFALCRLLEGFRVQPASAQCTSSLLSLQLFCQTLRSVLPSSLAMVDNAGRVVDAATHVLQRVLIPVLRHGIASEAEAEIVLCAPLVCASLRVLRALVAGFAPDLAFERRAQRDTVSLLFSEHFFRYSRSSLHEWALLLRQWGSLDQGIHSLICERMVPSPGRLSAMMMSRETEALLWERSLRTLGFYTYAMHISEPPPAVVGAAATTGCSFGASAATPSVPLARHAEFVRLLREQLTYAFQHFSSSAIPTVAQLQQKEVFLQPVRAALFVFRVVLVCNVRESLVASLWPIVLPELFRVLSIQPTEKGPNAGKGAGSLSQPSSADVGVLREIAATQMEALKVLDMDYTLHPAHALTFRWLFTDDAALESLAAIQARETVGPQGGLPCSDAVTRQPAVSHLEVLRLLQTSPQSVAEHLDAAAVVNAVHEPRVAAAASHCDFCLAAPLSSIPRAWPTSPRPSAADTGLRRPLYNIPSMHYQCLDGVYRAAQAFTLLLQRLNIHIPHTSEATQSGQQNAATLASLCAAVSATVGTHNEVDMAYIYDLLEADMTSTHPDTML